MKWEYFCDPSYYHKWAVRNSRRFDSAIHVGTKEEAEFLANELNKLVIPNPMIADAIKNGEDTTGLCTVRELAMYLIEDMERSKGKDFEKIYKKMETELFFVDNGYKVNIEFKVTRFEKV